MKTPTQAIVAAEFGQARIQLKQNVVENKSDRRYLLDRMRVAMLTLDDGHVESAQPIFEELYDFLRTQGINKDRTVQSVVLTEDQKIWKGEPFEQAFVMLYYGMQQASRGYWDNARAAADNSLFYLRDFGEDDEGKRLDTYEIARRSLIYERAKEEGDTDEEAKEKAEYLKYGYTPRPSNFVLGHLFGAVANQQLGRPEEASDHLTRVLEIKPSLEPLVEALRKEQYNTVLVVSWGLGPEKTRYGPYGSLARFQPLYRSGDQPLVAQVDDFEPRTYDVVTDVNAMAADHMWSNLEDVRKAKAVLGNFLVTSGVIATGVGAAVDSDEAVLAGLAAIGAGMLIGSSSQADIRYCDTLAQRYYLIPLTLSDPQQRIALQLEGWPSSRLVVTGIEPPEGPGAAFRYIRLPSLPSATTPPLRWAASGQFTFSNPAQPHANVPLGQLPYIFGGRDARPLSERALSDWQAAGYLRGMTAAQVRDVLRGEGIAVRLDDEGWYADKHVLEGGKSLEPPMPGTTGFMRLYCGEHPPYVPKTEAAQWLYHSGAAGEQPAEQPQPK